MSNSLQEFKDQAQRVRYAYDDTQRQYDEHPPNDDIVPVAAAINAWTLICGCYMGIEQTMKLLIRMRDDTPAKTHDLEDLYSSLDPSERGLIATCYRVCRSLHNFDSGNIALDSADEFIQYIGNGYAAWRYILVENPEMVPKMHLGLMLETWRALVDLVDLRVFEGRSYRTVATILEQDYIVGRVYRDAESDARAATIIGSISSSRSRKFSRNACCGQLPVRTETPRRRWLFPGLTPKRYVLLTPAPTPF